MYWLLCGLAGGLVGVATWGAVVFFGGRHVGWFAFVVGVLVGMSIRCAAVGALGADQGEIAVAIALPCILLGKYAGAHGMASRLRLIEVDDNFMTSLLADRIVKEPRATGQRMVWPPEKNQTGAPLCRRYPTEIWSEAERKWTQMSPSERAAEVRQHKEEGEELTRAAIANLRRLCFGSSFSVLNLLWIAVALLAAFCIASGRTF